MVLRYVTYRLPPCYVCELSFLIYSLSAALLSSFLIIQAGNVLGLRREEATIYGGLAGWAASFHLLHRMNRTVSLCATLKN